VDEVKTGALVHQLVGRAEAELSQVDPAPFSPAAFATLQRSIRQYIAEIISESI
jgi:hypothetical protein